MRAAGHVAPAHASNHAQPQLLAKSTHPPTLHPPPAHPCQVDWDGDPGRCIHVRIPPEDLRFFSALREEGGSGGDDDDEDDEEEEEEGEPGEGEQEMEESARGGGSSGEEAREPPLYNFRYAVSRALAGQQATLRALALQERSARRAAAPPRVPYASEAYELA